MTVVRSVRGLWLQKLQAYTWPLGLKGKDIIGGTPWADPEVVLGVLADCQVLLLPAVARLWRPDLIDLSACNDHSADDHFLGFDLKGIISSK